MKNVQLFWLAHLKGAAIKPLPALAKAEKKLKEVRKFQQKVVEQKSKDILSENEALKAENLQIKTDVEKVQAQLKSEAEKQKMQQNMQGQVQSQAEALAAQQAGQMTPPAPPAQAPYQGQPEQMLQQEQQAQ